MSDAVRRSARDTLLVGLRDAHAMERQAVAVLEQQAPRLTDHPEFRAGVLRHAEESRMQAARLENALRRLDSAPSTLKGVAMSAMGLAQSSVQGMADDAAIKAVLADAMFERFEIAAYRSLLELVTLSGHEELRADVEQSLREEEAMSAWVEAQVAEVTRRYVELRAASGPSDAAGEAAGPEATAAAGSGRPAPADAPDRSVDAAVSTERPMDATVAPEQPSDAAPEQPLRDLDEFTDPAREPDAWPTGAERPETGAGAAPVRGDAPARPLHPVDEIAERRDLADVADDPRRPADVDPR